MKIYRVILLLICFGCALYAEAQPQGVQSPSSNDITFGSDSVIVVTPEQVYVNLELQSSTDEESLVIQNHRELQTDVLAAIDAIGATYQGQADEDFEVRRSSGFIRREQSFLTSSRIEVTLKTDDQLVELGNLIDERRELEFLEFNLEYSESDSLEEIQKRVIDEIIADAQTYQKENGRKLTPRGISKLDIASEEFGQETLEDILEDNRLRDNPAISDDSFSLIGINHEISAELIFK